MILFRNGSNFSNQEERLAQSRNHRISDENIASPHIYAISKEDTNIVGNLNTFINQKIYLNIFGITIILLCRLTI